MSNHKFEPQCKTREDLQCEFARVLVMCATAKTDAIGFWRINGITFSGTFDDWKINPELVEWPIAIVEGKLVFRGDVLYPRLGQQKTFIPVGLDKEGNMFSDENWHYHVDGLSWNPPQRTIEINGLKVPAPTKIGYLLFSEHIKGKEVCFSEPMYFTSIGFTDKADAEAFKAAMEGKAK